MKLSEKKRLALVLSGGGIKAAAFHIGVCLALREKGFKFAGGSSERVSNFFPDDSLTFKTYVGSSAGAVISAFLASGYGVNSIINAFTQGAGLGATVPASSDDSLYRTSDMRPITYSDIFCPNLSAGHPSKILKGLFGKRPVMSGGLEVLIKQGFKVNGLFTTHNIQKYLEEAIVTDDAFASLGVNLFIVATQLNHSRKVVFGNFDAVNKDRHIKYAGYAKISEAVAASASLPPVFAPYGIHNHKGKQIFFFDGEIRDTLSTHVAADNGCDLVIASYSIQPYHYTSEMGSLHEYGIPMIFNQALYQVVEQKIISHIEHQKDVRGLFNAVRGYLTEANIPEEHVQRLLQILMERTRYKPEVDYVYIHPSPQDFEMFFADHFSLNPKILTKIVRVGFKSAMRTLRQHNIS